MSSLSEIWSLDGSAYATVIPYNAHLFTAAPAPADFDTWFVSHIALHRYSAHYVSKLLEIVPSSETRLRDGLTKLYEVVRGIAGMFSTIAKDRGIPVPKCPDIAENWSDESKIDYTALRAALSTHAKEPLTRYMDYSFEFISKAEYHWTTLVTPVSVSTDLFLAATAGGPGLKDNPLLEPTRVIREELMRIRGDAGVTGWKEEQARELTTGHLKYMTDFFSHGSQK